MYLSFQSLKQITCTIPPEQARKGYSYEKYKEIPLFGFVQIINRLEHIQVTLKKKNMETETSCYLIAYFQTSFSKVK